jgi:CBS domain-containing protein
MENPTHSKNSNDQKVEFKRFATKRIIVCTLLAVVGLWLFGAVLGFFEKPSEVRIAHKTDRPVAEVPSVDKAKPEISHEPAEKEVPKTTEATQVPKTKEHLEDAEGPEATDKEHHYDKDTAGGIMTPDFIALDKALTAQEAVEHLRKKHHDIKQPIHLFVVDEHGKLLGTVSMEQLMFAASDSTLEDFMDSDVLSANTGLGNEKVKNLIDRHHLQTVPVVDNTNRLVGIVKADQVIRLCTGNPLNRLPTHRHRLQKRQLKNPNIPSPPLMRKRRSPPMHPHQHMDWQKLQKPNPRGSLL